MAVSPDDNVAVATRPLKKGDEIVVGGQVMCVAAEDIELGHKVALSSIAAGKSVMRYGEPIVRATRDIRQGALVHVHNTEPLPGDLKE